MTSALILQPPILSIRRNSAVNLARNLTLTPSSASLRRFSHRFTVISVQSRAPTSSEPSVSSEFTSSVGSPHLQLYISHRHLTVLNLAACAVAISAAWLFCSAIPTLLAFKRAAESLEKLLDVIREELPDTMAAVRLSGMEISDLTMELSDLGQEINRGVKKSTNAVRVAEESFRHFANMTSAAPIQVIANPKATTSEPAVARTARSIRQGIVKGRAALNIVFFLSRISRSLVGYFLKRSNNRALNK